MTIDVRLLFVAETAAGLLNTALELAAAVGLPVTSWRAGDPTRTTFKFLSNALATRDRTNVEFIKAGFLSTATGDWKTVVARETYGRQRGESSPSTPTVTVHNGAGGLFEYEAGDVTFSSSASDATFHNTDGPGVLAPGASHTFELVADVEGTAGNVATDEVDTMVTTWLGVTVVSSTASFGVDAQDDASLEQDCNDTLGALSPDGPPDAYEYVVRQSELTGVTTITRAASTEDSGTFEVIVYIAGPDGAVDGASVTAAQDAIERWATPLCVTPTVVSATNHVIAVTAVIDAPNLPDDFVSLVTDALGAHFSRLKIAKEDGGVVSRSAILTVIRNTLALAPDDNVTMSSPAADVSYVEGEVPTLGATSITEAP